MAVRTKAAHKNEVDVPWRPTGSRPSWGSARGTGVGKVWFPRHYTGVKLVPELIECSVCWQVGILAGRHEREREEEEKDGERRRDGVGWPRFVSDAVAISVPRPRLFQVVYLSFSVTVSFSPFFLFTDPFLLTSQRSRQRDRRYRDAFHRYTQPRPAFEITRRYLNSVQLYMPMIHAAIWIESQPSSHCLFLIPFLDRRLTWYALMLTKTYNEDLNDNLELVCWFDDAYLTLARVCRMPNPMFFRNVLLTSVCLHRISHESYCCIRVGFKEWQSVLLKNAGKIAQYNRIILRSFFSKDDGYTWIDSRWIDPSCWKLNISQILNLAIGVWKKCRTGTSEFKLIGKIGKTLDIKIRILKIVIIRAGVIFCEAGFKNFEGPEYTFKFYA